MEKVQVYLDDELEAKVPGARVEEYLHAAMERVEAVHLLGKFGSLPAIDRVSYPLKLAVVVDEGFQKFLARQELRPLDLSVLPSRLDSYYVRGRWINPPGSMIVDVNFDPSIDRLTYELKTSNEGELEKALAELRRLVDSRIRGRVLQYHDHLRVVKRAELKSVPSWPELRPTVDSKIAHRVENVVLPFFERVEQFREAGVPPRLGVMMVGTPGTGKTYLVRTLIKELYGRATIAHVSADQFLTGRSSIRDTFSFLQRFAPLVMILEDLEMVARSRQNVLDNPTVQALLDVMDGAVCPLDRVMVVATTNLPEQVDDAFKRPGRFDEVWQFGPPPEGQALKALEGYFSQAKLATPARLMDIVSKMELTYAELRYVSVDLIREALNAGRQDVRCSVEELKEICESAKRGVREQRMGFGARQSRLDELLLTMGSEEPHLYDEPEEERPVG